jgi:hypothetical protein
MTTPRKFIVPAVACLCLLPSSSAQGGGAPPPRPLLQAAWSSRLEPQGWTLDHGAGSAGEVPMTGWLGRMIRKHRFHAVGVFLAEEADHLYDSRVGPPAEPRLFGDTPSLDESIHRGFDSESSARPFLIENKTMVLRVAALGAMAFAHGRDWVGLTDDAIGLIEAHKINWSASGLVKNIVGRPRPGVEAGEAGGRDSFYSDAASKAFTYMAYTDSVLARRLKRRPWARALGAAGLYGVAGLIAWSRVEEGRHYVTDVVAGAAAGFTVGKLVYRMNHPCNEAVGSADMRVAPLLVPGGAGLNLAVRF